jgi:DNA polymerase III delta prime subunit
MHAYLLVGRNIQDIGDKIKDISKGYILYRHSIQKIADVRELSKVTKLSLTQKTAFLLEDFHDASEEAQNAFLKNLEEPQKSLIYILTAKQTQTILATIVSRCTLIELPSLVVQDKADIQKALDFIKGKAGDRFQIISKITDRGDAIEFLEALLIEANKDLPENQTAEISENAFKALENIKKNGNVSLQLTNLVVQISK